MTNNGIAHVLTCIHLLLCRPDLIYRPELDDDDDSSPALASSHSSLVANPLANANDSGIFL